MALEAASAPVAATIVPRQLQAGLLVHLSKTRLGLVQLGEDLRIGRH
ncbi:hypothetical protein ACX9I7_11710 [Streptomyces sp. L500]